MSGIVLTDPLLKTTGSSSIEVLTSFDLQEGFVSSSVSASSLDRSCRQEVIEWVKKLSNAARSNLFNDESPLAIRPLIRLIVRTGASILLEYRSHVSRIFNRQHDHEIPNDPKFCLYIVRRAHKNLHNHSRHLKQNKEIIRAKVPRQAQELIEELTGDISFLQENMEFLLSKIEQDNQFLASDLSFQQSDLVNKLTKFAFLFVPMGTVASILAIPNTKLMFTLFAAITIPLISVVYFIMFWATVRQMVSRFGSWAAHFHSSH
jgi:Mg2+ and Co2+ transporter CorA